MISNYRQAIKAIIELSKLRVDAIAENNHKKAQECSRRLQECNLYAVPVQQDNVDSINRQMEVFNCQFDIKQLQQKTNIEVWETDMASPYEFTVFILYDKTGYLGHRIVKGY